MLRVLTRGNSWHECVESMPLDALWIDLFNPTHEEIRLTEVALGIDIPTLSEMNEIVPSKRLFEEGGALFVTVLVPTEEGMLHVKLIPVTCIFARDMFLTLRYSPLPLVEAYLLRTKYGDLSTQSASFLFVHFLTALLDGIADLLERITAKVDLLSRDIFQQREIGFSAPTTASISILLQRIGLCGETTACLRDGVVSFELLLAFLTNEGKYIGDDAVTSLEKDVHALKDLTSFLSGKVSFLLNATLGLVNLRQNDIIKIFSVVSVIFLPPTLLTGLWGMNFHYMPELFSPFGYPVALCVILMSAATPYLYCKKKGWL